MKSLFGKKGRILALLLCALMLMTLLPSGMVTVSAAADDVYANEIIRYSFNSQNTGYYFTPIATGKYPTFVMIHGWGGDARLRSYLRYFINEWVKAGYFPPMNVIIPSIEDFDGVNSRYFDDFHLYMKKDHLFGTLLESIESGSFSSQIDTTKDIMVGGFSMGGMCALSCGSEYSTRVKKIGGLSPAAAFYFGEGSYGAGGYYTSVKDINYSKDPDAFVFMSGGQNEGDIPAYMDRFEVAINTSYNRAGILERFNAPASWGGHEWPIEEKEIFMYLYRCFYGEYPKNEYVESICHGNGPGSTPAVRDKDSAHPAPTVTVEPYGGSKLVNLDMSTYTKDTTTDPLASSGSIGNVTNTGTLSSSTKVKMSSKSGTSFGLDTSKKTFTNSKGATTSYLYRKVNDSTSANNNYTVIEEPALETRANTISFWAKYTPINKEGKEYSFFDYNVSYDGTKNHLFTFDQQKTTSGQFVLTGRYGKTGRWDDTQFGDITDEAAGKWAHYTITNPEYSSNGKKTIKVYLNGKYLYSKMVKKPSGSATGAMLTFGGENTPGSDLYWPDTYALGNVTVYDGVLTANEIFSEYSLSKDYYTEGTSSLPSITGYSFNDSTVTYDGANHMINVAAGTGATQGVNIAYTFNGSAFAGATLPGTYYVTATITKEGYQDLVLNATLKINPATISGYTLSDATVTYDGASHMINVTKASNATSGVSIAYTSNGAAFSGASAVGTYPITATISKTGYANLVLTATLRIKGNSGTSSNDELLDLDMTNLVPESVTPTASSVAASSGITKSGDWAETTTLGFSQRPDGNTTVKKGSLQNADGGTTYYLSYNNKVIYPNIDAGNSYARHLINLQMHNNSFEAADNTISFWVNETKSNMWKEIMCYRVDYTSGGSKAFESFDLGMNADGTWNALSAPTESSPSGAATNAFSVPDGWKHVVITNPKRSGSKKMMNVYVNGALKKTVTLDIPDGATIDRATISFFSKSVGVFGTGSDGNPDGPWRTREAIAPAGKIGDFKIYEGALNASEVSTVYDDSENRYTEGSGTPALQDITGYTFANKTVTYDGQNHMINVTAGSGATQGVTTTYTSGGAAFSGATAVGTYPITATIKKSGYNDLTLTATLTIEAAPAYVDYEVKGIKNGDRFAVSEGEALVQRVYVVNENSTGLTPADATGLTSADFYVDGTKVGSATQSPFFYDVPITSGNHTLKVVANKAGGGTSEVGTYSYTAANLTDTADSVCENFESGAVGANVSFGSSMSLASTESCTYKVAPETGSKAMAFTYDGEHESGSSNIFLKNIAVPDSKIITFDYDFYSETSSGNAISHQMRNPGGSAVVAGYTFGALSASSYAKNTWHHMSYVFDFESLTYRGYLDGYEIERGTLNSTDKAHARFYLNRYSKGTLYVDNVKFCAKEESVTETSYEVKGIKSGDRFAVYEGERAVQRVYVVDENSTGLTPADASGLTSADFYVDGTKVGSAVSSPFFYDVPITSGSHTLRVVANKAGSSSEVGTYSYTAYVLEDTADSITENFDGGTEGSNVSFGTMNIAATESCTYQKAPGTDSMAMTFTYDGEHESGASNIFLKNIPVPESKIMTFDYDFYSADSSGNMITHQLRNNGGSAVVPGYTFGTLTASKYLKDTWHHVSYVFDFESHTFRGYLDGYEIERGTLNDTENANARFYLTRYSRGTLYVDNMKFCAKTGGAEDNFKTDGSIAAGSSISATYTLAEGEEAPVVFIAVYKDGGIVCVNMAKTAENGKVTAEISFDGDTSGYTAKAFVWKNLQTLEPLEQEIVIE